MPRINLLLSAYVSCDTGLANVTSPRRNSPDGEARRVTTQVNLQRALGLFRSNNNNQLAIPKKVTQTMAAKFQESEGP